MGRTAKETRNGSQESDGRLLMDLCWRGVVARFEELEVAGDFGGALELLNRTQRALPRRLSAPRRILLRCMQALACAGLGRHAAADEALLQATRLAESRGKIAGAVVAVARSRVLA